MSYFHTTGFVRLISFACVWFATGATSAQTTTVTQTPGSIAIQAQAFGSWRATPVNFTQTPINGTECDTPITFRFSNISYSATAAAQRFDIWRTTTGGGACQTATNRSSTTGTPSCTHVAETAQITANMQDFQLTPRALFGSCAVEQTYVFYFLMTASTPDSTTTITAANYGFVEISLDGVVPAAPTLTGDAAGDANINLAWTNPAGTTTLYGAEVYVDPTGCTGSTPSSTILVAGQAPAVGLSAAATPAGDALASTSVAAATLGVPNYGNRAAVAVLLVDRGRNRSVLSNIQCVERVHVEGFFDSYCNERGLSRDECKTRYGCAVQSHASSNVPRTLLGLMVVLLFLLTTKMFRTKRTANVRARGMLGTLVLVSIFWASNSASAQMRSEWDRDPHFTESPENFTLELRAGPYQPNMAAGIFATNFRGDQGPLVALELDVHLLRIPYFGVLGVGMGAGWVEWTGPARATTSANVGETGLSVVPVTGVAVLRIDALSRHLRFPLILSAKFGVDAGFWKTGTAGITDAEGWSAGIRWSAQAALQLDFLEPRAARRLDEEWGINHAEIFFELYQSQLGGFNQNRMLQLQALTWSTGLGFTF